MGQQFNDIAFDTLNGTSSFITHITGTPRLKLGLCSAELHASQILCKLEFP